MNCSFPKWELPIGILICILILGIETTEGQNVITSVRDGNWENSSTWDIGVPGPNDTVIIACHNITIDEGTGTVNIKRLEINNLDNINGGGTLKIRDTVTVTVSDSIVITMHNVGKPIDLFLYDSSTLNAKDLYMHRTADNTRSNRMFLEINHDATLNISQNFQYDYLNSGNESSEDIRLDNNSTLNVEGDMIINHLAGKKMKLIANSTSTLLVGGDLLLNHEGGDKFFYNTFSNSLAQIDGDLKAINDGAGADLLRIDKSTNSLLNVAGEFLLRSVNASDEIELELSGNGNDTIFDLTIEAVSDAAVLIDMNSSAQLNISGAITRTNGYGSLISSSSSTIAYIGDLPQTIVENAGTGNDNFDYANLLINNTSNTPLDLSGPVTIRKKLTLINGIVNTDNTNTMTIDNGSVVGGSSNSYVDGPLTKLNGGTFVFPVGNNGVYAPIEISTPGTSGNFTARYFNTAYSDLTSLNPVIDHVSSNEYWLLDRTAGNDVYVTLHWDDADRAAIDTLADLVVAHYETIVWNNEGNGLTSGGTGVGMSGSIRSLAKVTGFSPFTFASLSKLNTLPVELIAFDAVQEDSYVDLFWSTASEINNDYFIVQRSRDGISWEDIANIDGAGNSNILIKYYHRDNEPLVGVSYYRLKQVDFNQQFEYSKMLAVNFQVKNESQLIAYPNPTEGPLNIISTDADLGSIQIYSMMGQNISDRITLSQNSINSVKLDLSDLSPGLYLINTGTATLKVLKK